MLKRKLAKIGLAIGLLALCWLLDATGLIKEGGKTVQGAGERPAASQVTAVTAPQAEAPARPADIVADKPVTDKPAAETKPAVMTDKPVVETKPAAVADRPATVAKKPAAAADKPAKPAADDGVVQDGEYYDKDHVAAYIRKFDGKLPRNYITKSKAKSLGWQGGPLEPYAPGKAIGGDWFGNYEHRLPNGTYKECDIGTRGRPRGTKRLIYTPHGKKIYYTADHYETFEEVVAR